MPDLSWTPSQHATVLLTVFGLFVVITPVLPSGEPVEVRMSQIDEETLVASTIEEMYGDTDATVMKDVDGTKREVEVTVRGGLLDRAGLNEPDTPPAERADRIVDSLRVRYPAFDHVDSLTIHFENDVGFVDTRHVETYARKDL
jgi:hypothetical protein